MLKTEWEGLGGLGRAVGFQEFGEHTAPITGIVGRGDIEYRKVGKEVQE